jgi:hypothetical protein
MTGIRFLLLGLIILTPTCLGFGQEGAALTANPGPAPTPFEPVDASFIPTVEGRTEALKVLGVVRREIFLEIKLKNVGEKNICAFRMLYHRDGPSILYSFVGNEEKRSLTRGEIYKLDYPYASNFTLAREPLIFQAVLFEDGTGDGEADKVRSLQDLFRANQKELEYVIDALRTALKSPDLESTAHLEDLEATLARAPDDPVDMAGLAGATLISWKLTSLRLIQNILRAKVDDATVNVKAELEKIEKRFEKTLAGYPGDPSADGRK